MIWEEPIKEKKRSQNLTTSLKKIGHSKMRASQQNFFCKNPDSTYYKLFLGPRGLCDSAVKGKAARG